MGRHSKQSGSSIIKAILAVAAIAIIGIAGWLVYQQNRKNAQPAPTVAYLTIKEWGIKLPLPYNIKDAYYNMPTEAMTHNLTQPFAWLLVPSINNDSCKPGTNSTVYDPATFSPIGTLTRYSPTDREPVTKSLYTQLEPGTLIGHYYYAYGGVPDTTCGQRPTPQEVERKKVKQAAQDAFAKAAKHITTATN